MKGRRCGSENTADGKPCRNPAESCPIQRHKNSKRRTPPRARTRSAAATADLSGSESGQGEYAPMARAAPGRFRFLRDLAAERTGLPAAQITHDYHLHRTLHGLASVHPCEKPLADSNNPNITIGSSWAFAGGTALVSAHRLADRFSEDIDLVVFVDPAVGRSPLDRTLRRGFLPMAARAANKLAALHEAASKGSLDQIRQRGRDLYDLACIARSKPHARAAVKHIAAVATHTAQTARTKRGDAGRPENGYSTSPVFDPETAAGKSLRTGYEQMQPMIFGSYHPSFEDALAAAKTLD